MTHDRLGTYVSIETGKLDANRAIPDGKYPFFTCSREISRIDDYAFDGEYVLVAGNGDLNVKYYFGKFNAYQRTYAIKVKDEAELYTRYLYRFLQKYMESLRQQSIGGVIKYIRLGHLTEAVIPIPPLETQKRIADTLDKAQELIDKRKQQIEMLDECLQSAFLDMFGDPVSNPKGWNMFPLGSIGKWQSGGTPPRKLTSFFRGDIPWFTAGELDRIYVTESIEMITEEALASSAAKLVETGSLLLGMYDTAALKSSINLVECSCNQAVAFAKLDQSKVCTEFAYYAIQIGRDYFKRFQRGVRQKNLNLSIIGSIKIPLPPIGLQSQFGKVVEATEKQRQLMENGLIEMENAFNSIMQRAFKGELFN